MKAMGKIVKKNTKKIEKTTRFVNLFLEGNE